MFSSALSSLKELYPFPKERPDFKPFYWSLDGGGRHLIIERAKAAKAHVVVEVGVFLGGSATQWLQALPDITVIGIDPWEEFDCAEYFIQNQEFCRTVVDLKGMSEDEFVMQMRRPGAFYQAAISNLWKFRDRFVPLRGSSPKVLYDLHKIGIKPDMFFLDSTKTGDELEVFRSLWPEAIISGDDWTWQSNAASSIYDIREAVVPFAKKYNLNIVAEDATWLLETFEGAKEAEIAMLQSALLETRQHADALRARLTAIETSTMWRATKPLRTVATWVPALIRRHLRQMVKAGYWLMTPHKIPTRIAFIRQRDQSKNVW